MTARSETESCRCRWKSGIALVSRLSNSPIMCLACRNDVALKRLRISSRLAQDLRHWHSLNEALLRLWLDSAEYEKWATERLRDARGRVNRLGLGLVADLNRIAPAWYWWFQDESRPRFRPLPRCPVCRKRPTPHLRGRCCKGCRIHLEP